MPAVFVTRRDGRFTNSDASSARHDRVGVKVPLERSIAPIAESMAKSLAPIALFVYRRPIHTRHVLDSLAANPEASESMLHIFCDGPKAGASADDLREIEQVRQIARAENRFKRTIVIERDSNLGLARSIVSGVDGLCAESGAAIVVEDDLSLSRYFLRYMNDGLTRYERDPRVGQIGACNFFACGPAYPAFFFVPIPDCWGWATWADRWRQFEPDATELLKKLESRGLMHRFNVYGAYGMDNMLRRQIDAKVDSWAIRWQAVCVLNGWLTLYPNPSMSNHIESLNNTHMALNILPPLCTTDPDFSTVPVAESAVVTRALKRGYAGVGRTDGRLNLRTGYGWLRYISSQIVPAPLLAPLHALKRWMRGG